MCNQRQTSGTHLFSEIRYQGVRYSKVLLCCMTFIIVCSVYYGANAGHLDFPETCFPPDAAVASIFSCLLVKCILPSHVVICSYSQLLCQRSPGHFSWLAATGAIWTLPTFGQTMSSILQTSKTRLSAPSSSPTHSPVRKKRPKLNPLSHI